MYDDFFSKANQLLREGRPFATAIVVRAERPTSAKPGDKAIITSDGVMHGWIGGSCAQPTVIQQALKTLADGEARFLRLSTKPETHASRAGLIELPLTCFSGGTLEIYIEPQLPPPRLMIIGGLPVAQALARLATAMSYYVVAVDPDAGGASLPDADEVVTALDQMPGKITPLTYVVVASHGHYDELALEQVLRSRAAYVALVASNARAAAVLDYLADRGLSQEALSRLKYPAGLDIQAARGDEIALSIMAEIVQQRRSARPSSVQSTREPRETGPEPAKAIDPVCGMTVQVGKEALRFQFAGQTFYFCCVGCQTTFQDTPQKYLAEPVPSGDAIDAVCGMTVDIATAKYMSTVEGTLFYFCAASCKATFDRDPLSFAERPD